MSTPNNGTNVPQTPTPTCQNSVKTCHKSISMPDLGQVDLSCQSIANNFYRIRFYLIDNQNLTTEQAHELTKEYLHLVKELRILQQKSTDLIDALHESAEETLAIEVV